MTVEQHATAAEVVRANLAENVARVQEQGARVRSGDDAAPCHQKIRA
jgi:cytochrome c556